MFLAAAVTLTTILQFARNNAQAFYLRGKCFYLLYDFRNALADINNCIVLHKSVKSGGFTSSISLQACNPFTFKQVDDSIPAWLLDFRNTIAKKVNT